ncbi:hypothetical protein HK097_000537, partial [Rhizophlyctis rosea]
GGGSREGKSGEKGKGEKEKGVVQEVTLIDSKKAQNIMIFLKRLKQHTPKQLGQAVLNMDLKIVTEIVAERFLEFLPKDNELKILQSYEDDGKPLRLAEQFLIEMTKIPRCRERLETIHFMQEFPEKRKGLDEEITIAIDSFEVLRDNEEMARVLELILTMGNYMNSGSFIGGVHGFRIGSINKLENTKASSRMSLLHFLARTIETKFPELKHFTVGLKTLEKGAKLSYQTLTETLTRTRTSLSTLRRLIATAESEGDESLASVLKEFCENATREFEEVEKKHEEMQGLYEGVARLFGEDPGKTCPEEFLGVFVTFFRSFQNATQDNARELERTRLLEKRKKQQEDRDMQIRQQNQQQRPSPPLVSKQHQQQPPQQQRHLTPPSTSLPTPSSHASIAPASETTPPSQPTFTPLPKFTLDLPEIFSSKDLAMDDLLESLKRGGPLLREEKNGNSGRRSFSPQFGMRKGSGESGRKVSGGFGDFAGEILARF